jgi:branched-chain amino acid transport system permease protein
VRDTIRTSPGSGRAGALTLALAVLFVALSGVIHNSYVLSIMAIMPIWALVGVSWNIFSGFSGLLSFGHAAFFGLGAYVAALLFAKLGISPWVGLPLAGVVGGLAGLLIGVPTFRLRGVYFSLAMLAYPSALLYVFEWLGFQEVALPMMREKPAAYMQFDDPRWYVLIGVVLLVIAVFVQLRIASSRFGLSLLAIKQNELAAQAAGIDPFRAKLMALVISGALTSMAGALYAVVQVIVTPNSAFGMLVSAQALIFAMFGGVGRTAGPVLGAVVLIALSESLTSFVSVHIPGISGLIYGVAIIAVVMLAPEGILPWLSRRFSREPARRPRTATPADAEPAKARVRGETGPVVLQVEGLSKHYGGLKAVQDASFEVRQGEILGVIGPNGAGKSTLFNLLNRIVPPSAGRVLFEGRDLAGLQPFEVCRLGVGRTFQVARPFEQMTVLQNVVAGALATTPDEATARRVAIDAIQRVDMSACSGQLARHLTAVELRLMEIGRALASAPRLLLLDEALAGLGGHEVERVLKVLMTLSASGLTIVIIEHTMHAMVRLADRLLVLDHGKVLKIGEPAEVTSDDRVIEAYLGKKWVAHAED